LGDPLRPNSEAATNPSLSNPRRIAAKTTRLKIMRQREGAASRPDLLSSGATTAAADALDGIAGGAASMVSAAIDPFAALVGSVSRIDAE
jgi:hypothetical protein